jgi:hypothetical protein
MTFANSQVCAQFQGLLLASPQLLKNPASNPECLDASGHTCVDRSLKKSLADLDLAGSVVDRSPVRASDGEHKEI